MKYVFEFEFDSTDIFKMTGLTSDQYEKQIINSINKLNLKLQTKWKNASKPQKN